MKRPVILILSFVLLFGVIAWWLWIYEDNSEYDVIYLPSLGGQEEAAIALNDNGHITGTSYKPKLGNRSFFWESKTGTIDIGTLGGMQTSAYDINEKSQVVGCSMNVNGNYHAFIWDIKNGMRDIGTFGGETSYARAVNNHGTVVGIAGTIQLNDDGFEIYHTFLWDDQSGMKDLFNEGLKTDSPTDISDSMHIVGRGEFGKNPTPGFFWSEETGLMTIGDSTSEHTSAEDINEKGTVLGCYDNAEGKSRVFTWNKEKGRTNLDYMGGDDNYGMAINKVSDILIFEANNYSKLVGGRNKKSYLLKSNGDIVDLSQLFRRKHNFIAYDINNKGWIVGKVENKDATKSRAVLLKPRSRECSFNCVNGLNDFRQITLLPCFLSCFSLTC